MKTLKDVLLSAVSALPARHYITQTIIGKTAMSTCQKIIASLFAVTDKEQYGFFVGEEPVLIERIIEAAEMPFTGESYAEVKSRLFSVNAALAKIGVEITRRGDYLTVWGPGVKRG